LLFEYGRYSGKKTENATDINAAAFDLQYRYRKNIMNGKVGFSGKIN